MANRLSFQSVAVSSCNLLVYEFLKRLVDGYIHRLEQNQQRYI